MLRKTIGHRLCRIRQSVEVASANAAKEVARADALARAAQRAKNFGPGMKELERLKVPVPRACSSRAFCIIGSQQCIAWPCIALGVQD